MSCGCADRRLDAGSRECHCTGCGQHFAAPAAFDAHWVGSGDSRHCVDPATLVYGPRSARAGQPKFELRKRAGGLVWSATYEGEHPMAAKHRTEATP